jgi:hypothetical protein
MVAALVAAIDPQPTCGSDFECSKQAVDEPEVSKHLSVIGRDSVVAKATSNLF